MTVDGPGSTWTTGTGSFFCVGGYGNGTLNVTNGATVVSGGYSGDVEGGDIIASASGTTGMMTVDGAGSTWIENTSRQGSFWVGYSGTGTLNVRNGATVKTTNPTYLGYNSGATGCVIISGAGSTWNGSIISVGESGVGTLSITSSGSLNSSQSAIGDGFGSTGTVTIDGTGSIWTAGSLIVGSYGRGTLTITNGGVLVSSGVCYLGYGSSSSSSPTGLVAVDGTSSTWSNNGSLYVGRYGGGTLSITNGGSVTVAGTTFVAYYAGSSGAINFPIGGGTLTTQGLWALPGQLTGTGTINTRGLVSDTSLLFDSAHSLSQTFMVNQSGQNITLNLDMTNNNNVGDLGVGYQGSASLTIRNGVAVELTGRLLGL